MNTRWDAARARSRQLPRKYKQVEPIGDAALNLISHWGGKPEVKSGPVGHMGDASCAGCGFRVCCCDGNGLRVTKHECGCYEASTPAVLRHFPDGFTLLEGQPGPAFNLGKRVYVGGPSLTWIAYCDACKAHNARNARLITFGCEVEGCGNTKPATKSEYDALNGSVLKCDACFADELVNPELLPDGRNSGYGHTADGVPIFYYSHVKRGDAHVYFEEGGKAKAVYAGLLKRSQMLKLRAATVPKLQLGELSRAAPVPELEKAAFLMPIERVSKADLAVMYPEPGEPHYDLAGQPDTDRAGQLDVLTPIAARMAHIDAQRPKPALPSAVHMDEVTHELIRRQMCVNPGEYIDCIHTDVGSLRIVIDNRVRGWKLE